MSEILTEITFGSGAWFGFLIITILSFVGIAIYKYIAVITAFLFVLLGVEYFNLYSAGNSNLTWFWLFSWVVSFLQIMFMLKRK